MTAIYERKLFRNSTVIVLDSFSLFIKGVNDEILENNFYSFWCVFVFWIIFLSAQCSRKICSSNPKKFGMGHKEIIIGIVIGSNLSASSNSIFQKLNIVKGISRKSTKVFFHVVLFGSFLQVADPPPPSPRRREII